MIQVAVMGYGTIGSGVVEVLETNKDKITEKTGKEIAVKYILDLREFPGDPYEAQIVHDFEIIEKDEEVEIVRGDGRRQSGIQVCKSVPVSR